MDAFTHLWHLASHNTWIWIHLKCFLDAFALSFFFLLLNRYPVPRHMKWLSVIWVKPVPTRTGKKNSITDVQTGPSNVKRVVLRAKLSDCAKDETFFKFSMYGYKWFIDKEHNCLNFKKYIFGMPCSVLHLSHGTIVMVFPSHWVNNIIVTWPMDQIRR